MVSGRSRQLILAVFAMLIVGFLIFRPAPSLQADTPYAARVSDLKTWSFEEQGAYQLKDGWTVYRDTFIAPADFEPASCAVASDTAATSPELISAPDLWGPSFTTSIYTGHGTATYCQHISLPVNDTFFSIRTGTLRSISHIYAVYQGTDGRKQVELLQKNGDLDTAADQIVNNPAVPTFTLPYGIKNMTLVIQLSNRIHKQGGMVEVPKLDFKWRLDAEENRATALPSALVICLILVALAALLMGHRGSDMVDHRLFGFLAFAAASRAAFVSDLVWDYVPAFSLARKYDLEYLSLFVIAVAYYTFVNQLLRPGRRLKIDYVIYGLTGSLIFFAIFLAPFTAPGTITLMREPIQIIWASIVLMVVYSVFHTTIRSPELRKEAVTVSLAAATYAAYEILSTTGAIAYSLEWSQFIIFVVVMMHAHAFVIKARKTEHERDALLERLRDANRDLQNRALALDLALKRAEQANKAKSNFLATFSHELRTPLNAIIGFSELMSREVFGVIGSPHYKGYINDINSSGTHLLALVNDILDVSRIEAGDDELDDGKIDICVMIEEAITLHKIQAAQKNIRMKLSHMVEVPPIIADERKIKQVLINLITNAIKFNKKDGSIKIEVHGDETGLRVDVIDTGIGIAEEDISVVLSRFGQAASGKRHENSGVGIGLPLSEVLMRQHGGSLKVTSKLGEGTCVALWFPPERIVRETALA